MMTPQFAAGMPNAARLLERAEERIKRLMTLVTALLILLTCAVVFGAVQYARLSILQQEIKEGNQTTCDEDYVAKIVDGSKVTCVMQRMGPAMVAHKVVVKDSETPFFKRVSLNKKEKKNDRWKKDKNYPSVLDNWYFDPRLRNVSVPASRPRSLQ
jgi:hypothetical protein